MMCVQLNPINFLIRYLRGLNPDTLKNHIQEWSRLIELHNSEVLEYKVRTPELIRSMCKSD